MLEVESQRKTKKNKGEKRFCNLWGESEDNDATAMTKIMSNLVEGINVTGYKANDQSID